MSRFLSKRAAPPPMPQQPADPLEPPLVQGRYRIGQLLGSGGGSQVHEAIDLRTGATVALKLIHLPADISAGQRAEWLARLQREADLSRRLSHPDIVAVLAAGLQGHQAWLAMERVRGVDLARYTQPLRRLPENLVLQIGARVAAALDHAHGLGIVHRDLKPANVIVNLAARQVKLADFGVARDDAAERTRTGLSLGTPAYMAPELLAGETASPASDAYALGVMLFELLTSRRPHEAETLGALLKATASGQPADLHQLRPDLPNSAVALIVQLLSRRPEDRPSDLEAWAGQETALATLMGRLIGPAQAACH